MLAASICASYYHVKVKACSEWSQRLCPLCFMQTHSVTRSFAHSHPATVWQASLCLLTTAGLSRSSPQQPSPPPIQMCWLYPPRLERRKGEQWARGPPERETQPSQRPLWGSLKAGLCSLNLHLDRRSTEGTLDKWETMEFNGTIFIYLSNERYKHCCCYNSAD